MTTIDNYSICERMYQRFGAASKNYYAVLVDICKTNNIHLTSKNTGLGYRTVKDIATSFDDYIELDNKRGTVTIIDSFVDSIINIENGKEIPTLDKVYNQLKTSVGSFSNDNSDLDHISASIECCYKRAYDLISNYDIRFCKFLFLGDHDFTSICLGILSKIMGIQPNIVVMDIDENVLNHIKVTSESKKIRIDTFCCDFRCSVPRSFENFFDVVFTDPPYTPEGMEVFLSRAQHMLINNSFSTLIISYKCAEQSYSLGLNVQKTIMKSGFYIRELLRNYNSYDQAEALGYRSDLYVCSIGKKTQTTSSLKYNIYTHGRDAVEKINIDSQVDFSFIETNNTIYIGDDINIKIINRMSVNQFVQSRLAGSFHENIKKYYIVDLRNRQLMLYRILTICDFTRFHLISDRPVDGNGYFDCALYNLIAMAFDIKLVKKEGNYYVYLIEKADNLPIIAGAIGKRGTVRNYLTEALSFENTITKNEARQIIDTWSIPEIAKSPLFYLPNCVISKILTFIEIKKRRSLKK